MNGGCARNEAFVSRFTKSMQNRRLPRPIVRPSPMMMQDATAIDRKQMRASVTFGPLPQVSRSKSPNQRKIPGLHSKGFRKDYSLGEVIRHPSHVILPPTPEKAFEAVNSLQKHDFAFIKRSNGKYSYAILAFRSLELPDQDHNTSSLSADSLEEYMSFVMCSSGSTMKVKKENWGEFVCTVAEGLEGARRARCDNRAEQNSSLEPKKDDWVPPSLISFVTVTGQDDSVSLIEPCSW